MNENTSKTIATVSLVIGIVGMAYFNVIPIAIIIVGAWGFYQIWVER